MKKKNCFFFILRSNSILNSDYINNKYSNLISFFISKLKLEFNLNNFYKYKRKKILFYIKTN
jgi:hypothetical protein